MSHNKTVLSLPHPASSLALHALCGVTASFLYATSAGAISSTIDTDGDTVNDAFDVFPCNEAISSVQDVPAVGQFSTLFVEDQWPSRGDFDFNDFVTDYHVELFKNSSGQVRQIRYTFSPKAAGALFDNGFAIHLPVAKSAVPAVSIKRQVGSNAEESLSLANNETDVTFVVVNNIRQELFAGASAQINTREGVGTVAGQRLVVTIDLGTAITLNSADAPFDVFVFRAGEFGHQIHKPQFDGTGSMRSDLFATLDDGSSPRGTNNGRFFVDDRGVPFVLDVPVSTKYPKEDSRIDLLYPRIVDFAASGGTQFQNFFALDVDASRATSFTFANPAVPALNTDQSCLPVECVAPSTALIAANSVGGQTDLQFDSQCRAYVSTTIGGQDFVSIIGTSGLVRRVNGVGVNNIAAIAVDEAKGGFWISDNVNGSGFISRSLNNASTSNTIFVGSGGASPFWDNFHASVGPTSIVNDETSNCIMAPAINAANSLICVDKTTFATRVVATFTARNETVALDKNGVLYASAGDSVFSVDRDTGSTVLYVKLSTNILDMVFDPINNDLYVELTDNTIRKITPQGVVTTFASNLVGDARLAMSPDRRFFRMRTIPTGPATFSEIPLQ